MNPHSLSEAFLTIDDLFFKAAHSHYSPATSSFSSSSSSSSSSAHKHGRILSFVGQVVHSISATNLSAASPFFSSSSSSSPSNAIKTTYTNANTATSLSIPVDHEAPDRFPLHRQALWLFQKKCQDKSLDHVVWLALGSNDIDRTASLQENNLRQGQLRPNRSRSRSKSRPRTSGKERRQSKGKEDDQTVIILDSSDEEEHGQKVGEEMESDSGHEDDDDDGKGSAVSWSDSGASNHDDDDDEPEELETPERMVAVLLSDSFLQDGHGTYVSGSRPEVVFMPGDHVQISKAVLLYEEPADQKPVLTCLGIPGRTKFHIVAAPFRIRDTATPKIEQQRREESADLSKQHCERSRKRARTSSARRTAPNEAETVSSQAETGRVKKIRLRAIERERPNTPLLALHPQQDHVRDFNPLELLVRETTRGCSRDERERRHRHRSDNLVYFATLRSEMPLATATPTTSRSATPISYAGPMTEGNSNRASDSDSINNHAIITQHICWLTKIHSALIRAICATCENNYRNMNCTFGCPSRKWRLEIRMECYISDGTAEAQLLVLKDQEEIMWTLLGLLQKTNNGGRSSGDAFSSISADDIRENVETTEADNAEGNTCISSPLSVAMDPSQEVRNRVLWILARRGELSFKIDSAPYSGTLKRANVYTTIPRGFPSCGGYVDSINQDQSHRAKMEEKLWLDICTARPRKREMLLLYATTVRQNPITPSSSTTITEAASVTTLVKNAQLKTSFVRMNRHTTIQTLVCPPLVLRPVEVEWINARTEAKILLEHLLPQSVP